MKKSVIGVGIVAIALAFYFASLTSKKTEPTNPATEATGDEAYLWLEEVEGEKALDWVETQNASRIIALL